MLTGERPFDRGSLAGTLSAILRDTPAPCESSVRERRLVSAGLSNNAWKRIDLKCRNGWGGFRRPGSQIGPTDP
jgi:hypothetical protein